MQASRVSKARTPFTSNLSLYIVETFEHVEEAGSSAANETSRLFNKNRAAYRVITEHGKVVSKVSIITFFERLAKSTAERMPHVTDVHLSFFCKGEVYEAFPRTHSQLRYSQTPVQFYSF